MHGSLNDDICCYLIIVFTLFIIQIFCHVYETRNTEASIFLIFLHICFNKQFAIIKKN